MTWARLACRFDQHILDSAPQRARHFGSAAESGDEVRPSVADAEPSGKLRAKRLHFDGLVEKGIANAQCRGLQREPFVRTTHLDPIGRSLC